MATDRFQSPSLRGSGRFGVACLLAETLGLVSIPFIAGQWSLQANSFPRSNLKANVSIPFIAGQWSLPFGIKVYPNARRDVSIPFIAGQWSLQGDDHHGTPEAGVSIPFIAGQWSLLHCMMDGFAHSSAFQSPSLRGSGRFI